MNRFISRAILLPLGVVLTLGACEDSNVKKGYSDRGVSALYQAANCGRNEQSSRLTWLHDQQSLEAAYRRIRSLKLGGASEPPEVDFKTHGVALIELGQRATAGYQLRLESERMVMDKGDATIMFSVSTPDSVVAQVVTSPCLMVAVPRGDYPTVRALSTDNSVKLRADIQ